MSNNNKSGIDNFLISEKLFQRGKLTHAAVSSGQKVSQVSSFAKNNTSKGRDYLLLNDPMSRKHQEIKQHHQNKGIEEIHKKIKSDDKNSSIVHELDMIMNLRTSKKQVPLCLETDRLPVSHEKLEEDKRLSRSQVKRTRQSNFNANTIKRQIIKRQHDATPQIPNQQESPTTFQGIVVKSSRKYFDACRTQAGHYTLKMENMLKKEIQSLHNSLRQIQESVEESYTFMGQQIKQDMYKIIDGCVQQWKANCIQNFHKNEIDYMGQILQVTTLSEQRLKQIQTYKDQLEDQKYWRNRASDLLKTNYERDFIELSKLCQKSINSSEESVKQFLEVSFRTIQKRFTEQLQTSTISEQILKFLNGEAKIGKLKTNYVKEKEVQTPQKNEKSQGKSLSKSNLLPLTLRTSPQKQKRQIASKCQSCCRPFDPIDMSKNNAYLKNWKESQISSFKLNELKDDNFGQEESIKQFHTFQVNEKQKLNSFLNKRIN